MSEGFKYIERTKLSKAQKRRDAKEAKRAEQVKRIEQAEKEPKSDCVQEGGHEVEFFDKLFTKLNLKIYDIDADGDCLYRAVEHQLKIAPDSLEHLTPQELRQRTSQHMLQHKDLFMPFLSNDDGNCMTESQFQTYCDRIARTKEWGGHLELTAISQFTKKPIHVYQADSERPIIIESGELSNKKPILLSFHKHLYGLGEHYNSLLTGKS